MNNSHNDANTEITIIISTVSRYLGRLSHESRDNLYGTAVFLRFQGLPHYVCM